MAGALRRAALEAARLALAPATLVICMLWLRLGAGVMIPWWVVVAPAAVVLVVAVGVGAYRVGASHGASGDA